MLSFLFFHAVHLSPECHFTAALSAKCSTCVGVCFRRAGVVQLWLQLQPATVWGSGRGPVSRQAPRASPPGCPAVPALRQGHGAQALLPGSDQTGGGELIVLQTLLYVRHSCPTDTAVCQTQLSYRHCSVSPTDIAVCQTQLSYRHCSVSPTDIAVCQTVVLQTLLCVRHGCPPNIA